METFNTFVNIVIVAWLLAITLEYFLTNKDTK